MFCVLDIFEVPRAVIVALLVRMKFIQARKWCTCQPLEIGCLQILLLHQWTYWTPSCCT